MIDFFLCRRCLLAMKNPGFFSKSLPTFTRCELSYWFCKMVCIVNVYKGRSKVKCHLLIFMRMIKVFSKQVRYSTVICYLNNDYAYEGNDDVGFAAKCKLISNQLKHIALEIMRKERVNTENSNNSTALHKGDLAFNSIILCWRTHEWQFKVTHASNLLCSEFKPK